MLPGQCCSSRELLRGQTSGPSKPGIIPHVLWKAAGPFSWVALSSMLHQVMLLAHLALYPPPQLFGTRDLTQCPNLNQ